MKTIKITKIAALNESSFLSKHIAVGEYRIGAMDREPKIGDSFTMPFVININGKLCEYGRMFMTSYVTEIIEHNSFNNVTQFSTENSTYKIEIIKETFHLSDAIKDTKKNQTNGKENLP